MHFTQGYLFYVGDLSCPISSKNVCIVFGVFSLFPHLALYPDHLIYPQRSSSFAVTVSRSFLPRNPQSEEMSVESIVFLVTVRVFLKNLVPVDLPGKQWLSKVNSLSEVTVTAMISFG